MSTTTLTAKFFPDNEPSTPLLERILRDRQSIWQQIFSQVALGQLIWQMLTMSIICLACYGAIIGTFSWHPLQILASAIKMPILFLLTLVICLPTFYLFNLVCNGKLSVAQAIALTLSPIAISSILILAAAPIIFLFLMTEEHNARAFALFIIFNTIILSATSLVGLFFLIRGSQQINALASSEEGEGEAEVPTTKLVRIHLLVGWLLLYGFVGIQLMFNLRPFFGSPDQPFTLFLN